MISREIFTWFDSSIVAKTIEINLYNAVNFP